MNKKFLILFNSLRFRSFSFLSYVFFKKRRIRIKKEATQYFYNLPAINFDDWAESLDKKLFLEMKKFQITFQDHEKLFDFSPLGGARGLDQFGALYFFTRIVKPKLILETGVANGYSSFSFLSAMNMNKFGKLISNDLPPLDIKKEKWKFIGQMVPNEFQENWALHLGSDRNNLKKLCKKNNFELAHFDSDKTSSGKMFCINTLLKHNEINPIILIDNCADDFFWKSLNVSNYHKVIFEQSNKRFGALIHSNSTSEYHL